MGTYLQNGGRSFVRDVYFAKVLKLDLLFKRKHLQQALATYSARDRTRVGHRLTFRGWWEDCLVQPNAWKHD
jgi:hypothetical protein